MAASKAARRSQLTQDQQSILNEILADLHAPGSRIALCGFAGTGKTFLTAALVAEIISRGLSVIVATPTHKACSQVDRSLRKYGANGFQSVTVHRLLGLRLVRDYVTGLETFEVDPNGKNMLHSEEPPEIVFIDETSMLSSTLYELLLSEAERQSIVFVGDERQLLPVGENQVCRAFVEAESIYRLEEVLRHDGAILNLATATRLLAIGRPRLVDAVGGGSRVLAHRRRDDWMNELLNMTASEESLCNPDYCRVLAWTNRDVEMLNDKIHVNRYGPNAPQFVKGMTCVTVGAIPSPHGGSPLLNSTVDILIEDARSEKYKAPGDLDSDMPWDTWALQVSTPHSEYLLQIRVLDRLEEKRWRKKQKEIAEIAKETRNWRLYFERKDQIAFIQPASALTIHKSQGSTFANVFLHWSIDGYGSAPTMQQNRLTYVGVTRAVESLHVVADMTRKITAS